MSSEQNGALASAAYVGLSFEKQVVGLGTFDASNTDLVALFRLLGQSELRIGGSTVDTNIWNPSGPGGKLDMTSRKDLKRLAGFLNATGWGVKYGIRYKNTDVRSVVDEATQAAAILGPSLLGFEIGNEPDGYVDEKTFETTWEAYRATILASLPGATFMAPETAAADLFFKEFAASTAGEVKTLSAHHYVGSAHEPGATVDRLLHAQEGSFLAEMQQTWSDSGDPYYRVGETNSFYGGGKDGVSNAFASALWAIRYLLDGARYAAAGFNFHGGTSTEFGHELYYSPIRFVGLTGTKVIGVPPIFYGLLLAKLVGTGFSYATTVLGSSRVLAFAIGKNVVLINIDRAAYAATVTLPGPITRARSLVLRTRGGAGATHGQTLGGSAIALDGTFSPTYTALATSGQTFAVDLPESSATLIETR